MEKAVKRIIESSTNLPLIRGGAAVNAFNGFGPDCPVFIDGKGEVFVRIDDLLGIFSHVRDMAKTFAINQSKSMAAQASYNVGEFNGMERLMDKLAFMEKEAKENIPSAL